MTKRKNLSPNPLGIVIKVKPQVKKAKKDPAASSESTPRLESPNVDGIGCLDSVIRSDDDTKEFLNSAKTDDCNNVLSPCANSLVLYSDESEDDS